MEVIIPSSPGGGMGFDFNDARPLPFLSAPASPRRFGDLTLSAPTSPGRVAEFYRSFENFSLMGEYVEQSDDGGVPFHWEEKPGTPKSPKKLPSFNDQDFAFDFSADSEMSSLTADELFDDGKIRPLKLPPRMQVEEIKSPLVHSPRSPRSPIEQGKRIIKGAFSPRKKKDQAAPMEFVNSSNERGRGRNLTSSSSRRGAARSLSPYRVSQYPWEEEERQFQQQPQPETEHNLQPVSSAAPAAAPSTTGKSSSRKWRLRDLLLFRSASEGRAADRDPYRKHAAFGGLFRRHDDVKSCSIRSSDSNGSNSGSMRRKGPISAHELHYTKNKAASEDMKKRTYLPYKQGILGMRLAFSPSPAR
ncbi:unnamed protein product [Linum trigynum]|uniref:Uncharacterized protein n=1 Tax=Linum trigynum TaxID=586398 RepID=A0AAV2FCX9_9ROSI